MNRNDRAAVLIKRFRRASRNRKICILLALVCMIIVLYLAVAYAVGSVLSVFAHDGAGALSHGLNEQGRPVSLLVFVLLTAVPAASFFSGNIRNTAIRTDENGVIYLKSKTKDSAVWMDDAEIPKVFYVGKASDTAETIYGQLTDNGEKVVAWKKKENGGEGTRNDLIMATMGSGKTYTYVKNELIQTVLRGDSFIASDPKYELFTDLAVFCRNRGYTVHVLNMDRPEYSEFWNCIRETVDPKTERLDGTRLNDFVTIYMRNSAGGAEDYWYESAVNLVKAVIGYVAWKHEDEITAGYMELYKKITGCSLSDPVIRRMRDTLCSFRWCREVILKKAQENNCDIAEVESILHDIQYVMPKTQFTIASVVDTLLNFNDAEIRNDLENIPAWHPASFSYRIFSTSQDENVRRQALQGAQLKFAIFNNYTLRDVLSHDGIEIPEVNRKRSAYFVIMSDKTDTNRPIVSLFFSFFFKDVMDNYDELKQIADARGEQVPCLGVTAMLEEFFSIGVIAGSPEAFGKIMSTCRSRKIYVKVIIQYYNQLIELYGENIKDAIQGGCSTLLYLGGNDPSTFRFISGFAGSATVMSESHQDMPGLFGSKSISASNTGETIRPLVTESEARLWKNKVLLIRQGEYPVKIEPFPWTQHPVYKNGEIIKMDIYRYFEEEMGGPAPERAERIASELAARGDVELEIRNRIAALHTDRKDAGEDNRQDTQIPAEIQSEEKVRSSAASRRKPVSKRKKKAGSPLAE